MEQLRDLHRAEVGVHWTKEGCIHMIQMVQVLMLKLNISQRAACVLVAMPNSKSVSRVNSLVIYWRRTGLIKWREPSRRGRGSPNHVVFKHGINDEVVKGVFEEMDRLNSNGQLVTGGLIQQHLLNKHSIKLSLRQIRYQLRLHKCEFDKSVPITPVDEGWHAKRIARFIREYSAALAKEAQKTHVIVYTDESYIHNNHSVERGWFHPGSKREVKLSRRAGRLVFFHAITAGVREEKESYGGLLYNTRSEFDGDLSVETENAEYIYHIDPSKPNVSAAAGAAPSMTVEETPGSVMDKKDDKEDYHGNIDKKMWIQWLRLRLIPAFKARYPGMKMILIMDNASYHNPHDDDWVPVAKMKKAHVAAKLVAGGVKEFTVVRELTGGDGVVHRQQLTFHKDNWAPRVGAKGVKGPGADGGGAEGGVEEVLPTASAAGDDDHPQDHDGARVGHHVHTSVGAEMPAYRAFVGDVEECGRRAVHCQQDCGGDEGAAARRHVPAQVSPFLQSQRGASPGGDQTTGVNSHPPKPAVDGALDARPRRPGRWNAEPATRRRVC